MSLSKGICDVLLKGTPLDRRAIAEEMGEPTNRISTTLFILERSGVLVQDGYFYRGPRKAKRYKLADPAAYVAEREAEKTRKPPTEMILDYLEGREDVKASELAKHIERTTAQVRLLCNDLIDQGIVFRRLEDGTGYYSLSEKQDLRKLALHGDWGLSCSH